MATKNVWVIKSENCGMMGAYTTKKRAIIAANTYLTPIEELVGNWVTYDGEYRVELAHPDDFLTIEHCFLNQRAL